MTAIDKSVFFESLNSYIKENDELPADEHVLCDSSALELSSFYAHFQSIQDMVSDLWRFMIDETIGVLNEDVDYNNFSIREKLLAFYYTQMEFLNRFESIAKHSLSTNRLSIKPGILKDYKIRFDQHIVELVKEGQSSTEVAKRWVPSKHYVHGFWIQLQFILRFWARDESEDKEKTDAAIEKAVNVSLDLIAPGPIDSMFDLGKFILQNRK